MKAQYLEKFTKTLKDLVTELQTVFPESWEELVDESLVKKQDTHEVDRLRTFYATATEVGPDLSRKNEVVFSEEIVLIPGISFYKIWNQEISDEARDSLWKYLHTMYLYADHHERDSNLTDLIKKFKRATKKEHAEVDQQTQVMFGIIDNLCGDRLVSKRSEEELEKDSAKEDTADASASSGGFPGLGGLGGDNSLLGGSIGKLAGEIAGEINPEEFDMGDPNQMIQGLLSGNLDKNSPMLKMVNTINSKIQSKLTTGELNEMDLFQEAQTMMKSMGQMGGGTEGDAAASPFNMFQQMSEGLAQQGTATQDTHAPSGPSNAKKQKLKEKLRKKKQMMKAKRQMNQA